MIRIAHIVIAHKNSAQLSRLIQKLKHPGADFYVHVDLKVDINIFKSLLDIPGVSFIKNRISCNWGGNSLFMGIISSMQEVTSLKKDYDFINLLSGQDYPIAPAHEIHNYFEKHLGMNFISFEESRDAPWLKDAVLRYEKYHFTDFKFRWKYFLERVFNRLTPKRRFPIPGQLYGSSKGTWWTITEPCARYITNYLRDHKKVSNALKYCWATDEFVIPSLIMNSVFKDTVINNNLRYIDWSEGKASPKLLGIADFTALKNSNDFYARKFDTDFDENILNKIDKECIS